MNKEGNRRAQVFKNGKWEKINFEDIKKDDRFRLFEPNGKVVKGHDKFKNCKVFIALSDAFNGCGRTTIAVKTSQMIKEEDLD